MRSVPSSPAIGFLGDVMLGRGVGDRIAAHPREPRWDEDLRTLLRRLDLVVCNLECCISEHGAPTALIPGKPFFFRAPPAAIRALRAIGVRAVTLANNHALDFGPGALADTVAILDDAGIAAAGAGHDPATAARAAFVRAGDLRVGLVAVTDHPRQYAAAPGTWGVAHADLREGVPDWLRRAIAVARERADVVVVAPHWGPNMTTEPARWQRRAATALQDAGADLVAGHSAHLFHGVAWTDAGPVVHDLGDAIDDYRVDANLRNDLGLLAVWRPGAGELELVGLRLRYARTGLATGPDADWIADRLDRACHELGTCVTRTAEQRFAVHPR